MSPTRLTLLLPIALTCCTVDTSDLPPIDDYTSWHSVATTGAIPAHNDTYRITYVNDVGRTYAHAGAYPLGTVFVKEIRFLVDGGPGDLDYIAIMRKLDESTKPKDADLEGGWLFTFASKLGASELVTDCWESCHVQAPFDGAWLDHGE